MIARLAVTLIASATLLAGCAPDFKPSADYKGGFLWDADHSRSVTVGQNDTLYSISRQYDVPSRVIIARNGLQAPYTLQPGQTLVLDPIRRHRVGAGESLQSIASDYRVPQSLIVEANEMQPPYQAQEGQSLWIPDPFTVAAAEPVASAEPRTRTPDLVMRAPNASTSEVPSSGRSSAIVATTLPPPPGAAAMPGTPGAPTSLPSNAPVVINQPQPDTFALTSQQPMATPMTPSPAAPAAVSSSGGANAPQPETHTAIAPSASEAPVPLPRPPVVTNAPQATLPTVGAQASIPPAPSPPPPVGAQEAAIPPAVTKFTWPVKGRLISGYGPAGQGLHNDGINIAAPMGTQIRAAAGGTVVYAGNELKGFGNLLLIKHDNGLTTAYAHAEKLLVAKGDAVRQGQVIATVGKTGNVDAPQLHFEVRRGTQAVDPQEYLQH